MVTSRCNACGEEILKTGNYLMKVHPSKRIPKKSLKLASKQNKHLDDSLLLLTKFQKYLMRKYQAKNIMEIECGACGESSKIKMKKPKVDLSTSSVVSQNTHLNILDNTPIGNSAKRKRKNKTPKDFNAGLTIPISFRTPKSGEAVGQNNRLTLGETKTRSTDLLPIPSQNTQSYKASSKCAIRNFKRIEKQAKSNNSKELLKLKKVLFDSKNTLKATSSSSLMNFLFNK